MDIKYARKLYLKKKRRRKEKMEDLNKSWKNFHCNKETCIKMEIKKFRIRFREKYYFNNFFFLTMKY